MVLAARETRVILFLVTFFSLGLFLLAQHSSLRPIFDRVHTSDSTFALVNNTTPPSASSRVVWGNNSVPETEVLLHKVAGITVFKNLYLFKETIYVVTSQPETVPERRLMISNGLPLAAEDFKEENEPTDRTLSIITPREAGLLFGNAASFMGGVSFIQTDASQFLGHMYHFVVEIFALWHWRTFSSPALDSIWGATRPQPSRYIFPHAIREQWLDRAGMNLWTIRAAFGRIALEFQDDWDYRMQLERPFVLEYVVLGDRAAWHRVPSWKSPKVVFPLVVRDHWWEPVRELVTAFSANPRDVQTANIQTRPLITYVSRQKTGRRLKAQDHRKLVNELQLLCEVTECEVQVATMEDLDKADQIQLLSRTTILLGVHGNGLSGQLWLKPSPRTTVIEIYYPGGFLYDYEYTARSLGHKHYGFWNDKYFTAPDLPSDSTTDGFHGSNIPVNGTAVASLIYRRLTLKHPSEA